ncbi:hypothetical protein PybrP1_009508 [[Pythium] brassicae (nom. inval.)]|nr:hypothetical protein PybrP1_009508 [[Pythium] brassicae (nom. inval.)]
MDPQQLECFATAQRELQALFREISSQGRVGPSELQLGILPFTAGDAHRDVLELIKELRTRQLQHKGGTIDEQEFVRLLWRKMYAPHLAESRRVRPSSPSSSSTRTLGASQPDADPRSELVNIPLAHVIVSIKRRSQLKQFADYYASRGISGADHFAAAAPGGRESPRPSARSAPNRQIQRQRGLIDVGVVPVSVAALRAHTSKRYTALACVFDPETRVMKTLQLLPRGGVQSVHAVNCSKLHCLLLSKDGGNFVVGSAHFAQQTRQSHIDRKLLKRGQEPQTPPLTAQLPAPLSVLDERKIHHWTEPSSECTAALRSSQGGDDDHTPQMDVAATLATATAEGEGDCFGVLGAKRLLTRTKLIADVAGVKQLAAGDNFAMALAASGAVFVWGESLVGRQEAPPWKVPWFQSAKVTRIACGLHHAVVVTDTGDAYSWGDNMYGQLGLSRGDCAMADPPVREPATIQVQQQQQQPPRNAPSGAANASSRAVLDVACGDDHSVLLLGSGELFAFGNNWQGQLGLDPESTPTGCVFTPTHVALALDPRAATHESVAPPATSASVYLVSAYGSTTAAVTTQGDVFVWGACVPSGLESVCGLTTRWEPQLVDIPEPEDEGENIASSSRSLMD